MLDYQTQQFKLLPLIASAYAIMFAGTELRDIYFRSNSEIQQGNVELLPEVSLYFQKDSVKFGLKSKTFSFFDIQVQACRAFWCDVAIKKHNDRNL